jgi:hypothetical protein
MFYITLEEALSLTIKKEGLSLPISCNKRTVLNVFIRLLLQAPHGEHIFFQKFHRK